jgi:hypothetical protein
MLVTRLWITFWVMVSVHSHSRPLSMLALGMANVGDPTVMNTAWCI